jgi:hypothetical protein
MIDGSAQYKRIDRDGFRTRDCCFNIYILRFATPAVPLRYIS